MITFSKSQVKHLHKQIGHGILDSIGNFFKGAYNTVKSGYNSAKNYVSNQFSKPQSKSIEMKNFANIKQPKPAPYIDYGHEHDYKVNYKPPPKTTLDKMGDWAKNVDLKINKAFNYGYSSQSGVKAYKQQKLGYAPNGFLHSEDNKF